MDLLCAWQKVSQFMGAVVWVEFSTVPTVPTVLQGLHKCLTVASWEADEEKGFVRALSFKAYDRNLFLATSMNPSFLGSESTNDYLSKVSGYSLVEKGPRSLHNATVSTKPKRLPLPCLLGNHIIPEKDLQGWCMYSWCCEKLAGSSGLMHV